MHVALGSLKGVTWPQKPCLAGFKVLSSRRDMQKMLIKLDSEGACACQFPPKCMDCIVPTRWSWEKYCIGNQLLVVFSFISSLILYDLRQVTSSPSPLIYLAVQWGFLLLRTAGTIVRTKDYNSKDVINTNRECYQTRQLPCLRDN